MNLFGQEFLDHQKVETFQIFFDHSNLYNFGGFRALLEAGLTPYPRPKKYWNLLTNPDTYFNGSRRWRFFVPWATQVLSGLSKNNFFRIEISRPYFFPDLFFARPLAFAITTLANVFSAIG